MKQQERTTPAAATQTTATTQKENRERQEVRLGYRQVLASADANREELYDPTSVALSGTVDAANELFIRVHHPREAVLDSELMAKVGACGSEQVLRLQATRRGFDVIGFVDRLKAITSPSPVERWAELGRFVQNQWKTVPAMDFMFGPIAVEPVASSDQQQGPKTRKPRRAQRESAEAQKPDDVTKLCESTETETASRVNDIFRIIQSLPSQQADLWRLVTDPKSFGQTVENLFYVSFLVKEGRASIRKADGGGGGTIVIKKEDPPKKEDLDSGKAKRKQCMMTIDWKSWKKLAEKYGEEEPIVPHREPAPETTVTPSSEDADREERITDVQATATQPSQQRRLMQARQRRQRESDDEDEDGEEEDDQVTGTQQQRRTQSGRPHRKVRKDLEEVDENEEPEPLHRVDKSQTAQK